MRILIYEHVSGGGYAAEPLPPSLLCEGYAMLRGLTADFKAAGHEVTTLLDARIASFNPSLNADHVVQIASSGEADPTMEKAAEEADAVYVVAPEPNHVLQSIVECIETTGTLSLNCQSVGIEAAADKAALNEHVKQNGLNFPKTQLFPSNDPVEKSVYTIKNKLGFPSVIKPVSGAGCSGLSVVRNEQQAVEAIVKIRRETAGDQVAAQELIEGVSVSVSLFSTGAEALPVSLNLQEVTMAPPEGQSSYDGGAVPFDHSLKSEALGAAKQLTESFGGLRGYVGVDLILTKDRAFVLEINPRLTTSYVGLRKVADFNPAEAIFKAVVKGELPKNPLIKGYSCFSKIPISHLSPLIYKKMDKMVEVVSPPFPSADAELSYALVQSIGNTLERASFGLQQAKKRLKTISQGGA